jgi:hypothetical protein
MTGWTTWSLLAGASPGEAILTAVAGFAFFGWITVAVLAVVSILPIALLAALATQRRWGKPRAALAGAAGWLVVTTLPAILGTPLLPATGFGLPEVVPAAIGAGLLAGYIVGRPRMTFADAD